MAVDKLVDSTQLDSDLTSVANAIRAKSGGSSQLAFPAGFVSEIGNIPSGGGDQIVNLVKKAEGLFQQSALPEQVEIHFVYNVGSANSMIRQSTGLKNLTLVSEFGITNFLTFAYACTSLETVDFSELKMANSVNHNGTFWSCSNLTTIIGLDFSGATNTANMFNGCSKLANLTVKQNSCSISVSYQWSPNLSDVSLVSVANSLVQGSGTLTLHSTPKARCQSLMGTISQITDASGTYDFFTQDASGTVTLADFITNTKGWTLA